MALSNTTNWRVRAGGSNVNGGGYDAAQSGVLATTLNGAISSGTTTIVVASATGWPASGNYYARIGATAPETFSSGGTGSSEIVLVTAGQGTTSWTVTRGQLGTTAQAFATGIAVDNDLSRCNTAAAAASAGTSNASTTFTDAGALFNETHVGNHLWLASGTNGTVGVYRITGYTNTTTITLDRNCSTGAMTNGVWKIGGAWVDPITNLTSTNIKPGNVVYMRAGGSGSVASPDYTAPSFLNGAPAGDATNGFVKFITENGRAYIKADANARLWINMSYFWAEGFYFVGNTAVDPAYGFVGSTTPSQATVVYNCIADQNGLDITCFGGEIHVINCEAFSSTSNAGTAGTRAAIHLDTYGGRIINSNVHDTWGVGVRMGSTSFVLNNIIAKCRGDSVQYNNPGDAGGSLFSSGLYNNTIDAGDGHGIVLENAQALILSGIAGNIISNHTGASKYALRCNFGSTAANDRLRGFIGNNWYYNNTANSLNITIGSSLTTPTYVNGTPIYDSAGVDPGFTSQTTQDYSLTSTSAAINAGFPAAAYLQSKSGKVGPRSYMSMGGVQPSGATTTPIVVAPVQNRFFLNEEAA